MTGSTWSCPQASQVTDGAAAVLLMTSERAKELGQRVRARVVDQCLVGVDGASREDQLLRQRRADEIRNGRPAPVMTIPSISINGFEGEAETTSLLN